MDDPPIDVGIGLVGRGGRYLIRRRPPGGPMPGYWEFPGGKCEPGESPEHAAGRECREELGVDVRVGGLRRVASHRYPHGHVRLSYFDCTLADPAAEPAPGSGFVWVGAADLPRREFPPANDAVIAELAGGPRTP